MINAGVLEGLQRDASALLGGDIEIEVSNQPLDEDELARLTPAGATRTDMVRTNAMAHGAEGRRVVVALKAVDDAYPLYGAALLDPPGDLRGGARRGRRRGGRARPARPARASRSATRSGSARPSS